MADKTINVRLKQKYDTEANWTSANPVLLAGEMAISSDKNGAYKVGDGTSKWSKLSYAKQTLTKADVTNALGYTPPTTDTTYSTGTATRAGITKLYQETGIHTDGTMTQVAITEELDKKADKTHTHDADEINLPLGTNGILYNNNGDIAVSAVTYTELGYLDGVTANVQTQLNNKANSSHTHNYAGSALAGGSANSAVKLDTTSAGSATQPVYFSGGKPVAGIYKLEKSVPADAVFTDTKYSNFKGASTSAAGSAGLVPAPEQGETGKFLKSDGTWETPPSATLSSLGITATSSELNYMDGVTANVQTQLNGKAASSHTHNYAGSESVGGSANSAVKLDSSAGSATQPIYFSGGKPVACTYTLEKSVPSDAVFTDTNTWIALEGATASTAGTAGYVPAPAAGKQNSFLRGDGTWAIPTNTTYNVATTSDNGLMSSSDKIKLDGIENGANKYVLPTASQTTLGGVKTTSAVTSTSGYTACPIISGVPYYKSSSSVSVMGGATSSAAGKQGLVPAPSAGFNTRYLRGDATWGGVATTNSDGLMSSTQVNQLNDVVSKVSELNTNINGIFMIVRDRWPYVYDGNSSWTMVARHALENIPGYYPIGIVGYEIESDDYTMRSININDAYLANPRSFEIQLQLEKTQDPEVSETPWVTVYVLYIKSIFLVDPHPNGRPLP